MPTPSTSVINENSRLEIISKKRDLSRKWITIFRVTNHQQVFRVARKLGIECVKLNYNASSTSMKMVTGSSSEMREQITNQVGIK